MHIHALVLDGVFARGDDGRLRFHPAPELDAADVADVLAAIAPGVRRLVARHGGGPDDPSGSDAFADASPLLAGLAAASVQGGVALGGPQGARPRRVGPSSVERSVPALVACHARWEGFDLHAGVRVPAGQRDRLEPRNHLVPPPHREAKRRDEVDTAVGRRHVVKQLPNGVGIVSVRRQTCPFRRGCLTPCRSAASGAHRSHKSTRRRRAARRLQRIVSWPHRQTSGSKMNMFGFAGTTRTRIQ